MAAAPSSGTLWVVATPIGNLQDISARCQQTLARADLILCEDTRVTAKLLSHLELSKPLKALHSFNEQQQIDQLLAKLQGGANLALCSDAGTPAVSDPGQRLVAAALAAGLPVVPIPGPSAITALFSAAGCSSDSFSFIGFLPRQGEERQAALARLQAADRPTLFFESPQRVERAVTDLATVLEPTRRVVVGRELTKLHEEVLAKSIADWVKNPPRAQGEFVILVDAAPTASVLQKIQARITRLQALGIPNPALIELVAEEFDLNPKRVKYLLAE